MAMTDESAEQFGSSPPDRWATRSPSCGAPTVVWGPKITARSTVRCFSYPVISPEQAKEIEQMLRDGS